MPLRVSLLSLALTAAAKGLARYVRASRLRYLLVLLRHPSSGALVHRHEATAAPVHMVGPDETTQQEGDYGHDSVYRSVVHSRIAVIRYVRGYRDMGCQK